MLENLTKAQEQIMFETRDEWIKLFFDNVKEKRGINQPQFERGIQWLYGELLHKPAPRIVYCDSWMSCLLTIAILKNKKVGDSVRESVGESVWESVWESVRASVDASVWDSVRDSVRESVGESVWESVWASVEASVWDSVWESVGESVRASVRTSVRTSVWDSVGESVRASVWDSVEASVRASVGESVWESVWASVEASVWDSVWASVEASVRDSVRESVGESVWESVRASVWASVWDSVWESVGESVRECSTYLDLSNYGWVSFYDFFDKIGVLDNANSREYKKLLQSGVFNAYEYENYVFAIQPPTCVLRNAQGRLHSTEQAAVQFRDGSEYFFINGRSIPAWVITQKETITKELFVNETNADIKGAMYEVLGQKGMLEMLGATLVDQRSIAHANGDIETVSLLKTSETFSEIDDQPFAWVSMVCPSTGTHYLQGVEPKYEDALSAIASLSPFTTTEYSFNLRA